MDSAMLNDMSGHVSLHNKQRKKRSRLYISTSDRRRGVIVIAQLLEELPETIDVQSY